MTDYTALDWARDTLKGDAPTSTPFEYDALRIEYKSTFLPEGTSAICTTEEEADTIMAALLFGMSGSENDRNRVYDWYRETLVRFESKYRPVRSEYEVKVGPPHMRMVMTFSLSEA